MQMPIKQDISRLGKETLEFITRLDECATPDEVLERLHKIAYETSKLNMLGAGMFPLQWGDWDSLEKGKTVFVHRSVPDGWWDDHLEMIRTQPGSGLLFSQLSLAPFTMSELMRMLEPLGADRWPFELSLKYGMRDRLNCPVGGRWVVAYWSKSVLSQRLTEETRAILFMGATFAVIRIQKLLGPQACRIGKSASLTARELAVLRHLSVGNQLNEIARLLGIGDETVRSHLKKAQAKLGVRTRTHAVAQAIRRRLIP